MSGMVVTKSSPVVVVPSESQPVHLPADVFINLSSFDKCEGPFPVMLLLAFDQAINQPVETIKRALSRALAYYRPTAGRLHSVEDRILCSDEGVTFVGAKASCSLEELAATAPEQLKDLAVHYPAVPCRDADPLLMMQVTVFSCGGFVVGVTWNHVVSDGLGMGQFLQAVGELARGVSLPSVSPVGHSDDSLPGLPLWRVAMQKAAVVHRPLHLIRLDITVPSGLICRIKAAASSNGERCTVFEAVAAVLWQCRTRAMMSSDDRDVPILLAMPCNMRAHVGTTAGYYGNCTAVQIIQATSSAVASGSISDLVRLIKHAKKKAPDLLSKGRGDKIGEAAPNCGAGMDTAEGQAQIMYNVLGVVSWQNLGFELVDFGSGGAARVMWQVEPIAPICVVRPRCKDRVDGVPVSSVCVKPAHANTFLQELARLSAAS